MFSGIKKICGIERQREPLCSGSACAKKRPEQAVLNVCWNGGPNRGAYGLGQSDRDFGLDGQSDFHEVSIATGKTGRRERAGRGYPSGQSRVAYVLHEISLSVFRYREFASRPWVLDIEGDFRGGRLKMDVLWEIPRRKGHAGSFRRQAHRRAVRSL